MTRARLFLLLIVLGAFPVWARAEAPTHPTTGGSVLYLFAHQDDEIFVLGKMRLDVLAGREVHAAWITDGAKDGKAAARERESRAVMELLGVPEEHLHFLRFPDHDSIEHLPAIFAELQSIARVRPFAEVNSPAYEGGNIDHDVAAFMGALLTRRADSRPVHFEFPLYNHFEGRRRIGVFLPNGTSEERWVKLDSELRPLAQEALRLYRSQRVLLTYLRFSGRANAMLTRGQPYRLANEYNFLDRPVGEPCGYERSGVHRAAFGEWQREVALFLNEEAPPVADARTLARLVKRQAATTIGVRAPVTR